MTYLQSYTILSHIYRKILRETFSYHAPKYHPMVCVHACTCVCVHACVCVRMCMFVCVCMHEYVYGVECIQLPTIIVCVHNSQRAVHIILPIDTTEYCVVLASRYKKKIHVLYQLCIYMYVFLLCIV